MFIWLSRSVWFEKLGLRRLIWKSLQQSSNHLTWRIHNHKNWVAQHHWSRKIETAWGIATVIQHTKTPRRILEKVSENQIIFDVKYVVKKEMVSKEASFNGQKTISSFFTLNAKHQSFKIWVFFVFSPFWVILLPKRYLINLISLLGPIYRCTVTFWTF